MKRYHALFVCLMVPALLAAPKKSAQPQTAGDQVEVIGHVALAQGPAVNLLATEHWRRNYVYIEHGTEGAVTVVDVTDPKSPKPTGEFTPTAGQAQHIGAVEGSMALFVSQGAKPQPAPGSVSIMSFVDPAHPRLVRQFDNVTCILGDQRHGLTYLTNNEGLWILRTVPAPDREAEEEYERQLRYNH